MTSRGPVHHRTEPTEGDPTMHHVKTTARRLAPVDVDRIAERLDPHPPRRPRRETR